MGEAGVVVRTAGQVGHGNEFGPGEGALGDLGLWRPDEHAVLAHLVDEVPEPGLDRPVQVPDRGEVLQPRHELVGRHDRRRGIRCGKPVGVGEIHPLRPLEIQEVAQRLLAEGQQHEANARRVVASRLRKVGPRQMR